MSEKKSELKNPSALMRPAPFWSWNDKLDEAELRRQIREMAEKGWGSYFMHSRVGLVTGYLSDEWMDLCNACADEAEKTGTYAWLYDEDKWPSGFAGGEVPESSEAYRSRALVLLKKGEATADDIVLTSFTHGGVDYEICKRVAPLGSAWFNGASYVDLMSPDAVKEFINCTHERYKKACGEHFGKSIPGIFTDEPCYCMQNHYNTPVVPWSDFLPEFFTKMKGYDLTEKLPELFFDIEGYRKVRFDFYDAATELFKQSFTKQYYDWCTDNNLKMTGHFMAEDSLSYQTEWSGDVMSHYEFMHWPGIDKLCRMLDQIVTCKQVTSACDQLGKERSFCEVFGCVGGQVSFFHRKWIGDWQAALGISFVNHHLSLYSMRGERKRDYPANLFYQQPWWQDEREFADYTARLCAAVSEGEREVDILVIQPLSSVWAEFSPLHRRNNTGIEGSFDHLFTEISRSLMANKLDYHYGSENLMAKFGSVENGKLKVGQHSYSCVILPPGNNIKGSTLALLQEYAKQGGKLITTNHAPVMIDGTPAKVELPGAEIALSIYEAVGIADRMFSDRVKVTDTVSGGNANTVYVHSRKMDNSIRHLLVNIDEKREVKATVKMSVMCGQAAAAFDLMDGAMYKLEMKDGAFDVTLAPAGSILIICGDEAKEATEAHPAVLGSGALFAQFAKEIPEILVNSFNCELLEENVLLLNDFALELDGKKVYEGPVCNAWHNHFYPAKDGTPFKATYTFNSEAEIEGCFAAIEVAENLDSITFNGTPVKALKAKGEMGALDDAKSWKDINFTKVQLPKLQKGVNTLVIEGKKINNVTGPGFHVRVPKWQTYDSTEAEEVYICGNFSVNRLSDGLFGITEAVKPAGKNLTAEGFPFYSGRIKASASFELAQKPSGKVLLKLNGAALASAQVKVNGKLCGTVRWAPYVVDVTDAVKTGQNALEIEIATTLVNAFGPNRRTGIKDQTGIGPGDFIDMTRFTDNYQLFDFGIESAGIYVL